MNIKYHLLVATTGSIATGNLLFGIGHMIPDIPLIPNEIKLIKRKEKFDERKVDKEIVFLYHCYHSLLMTALLYVIDPRVAAGHFVHTLCDSFTHVGTFATRPFYPLSKYAITYGRNILK